MEDWWETGSDLEHVADLIIDMAEDIIMLTVASIVAVLLWWIVL